MIQEIPPQEQMRKWFRSHLLSRDVELQELYELEQGELDLLMAETAEIRSDLENRSRSHGPVSYTHLTLPTNVAV